MTVSDHNWWHLARILEQPLARKVLRLHNGVDLKRMLPREVRDTSEEVRVLCVARLIEKKGVDVLLRSLARLNGAGSRIRCTIVGDGAEREHLETLRSELELDDQVRFQGLLSHERVIEELRQADLFVLPSRRARDGDQDALPTGCGRGWRRRRLVVRSGVPRGGSQASFSAGRDVANGSYRAHCAQFRSAGKPGARGGLRT